MLADAELFLVFNYLFLFVYFYYQYDRDFLSIFTYPQKCK